MHLLSVRAQLGLRGRGYSAYCSTKGGLVMLIRQHASELASHGITVNGIAPTVVRTEMARHWLENPETRAQVLGRIPLGRVADPKDVAGAALFFASPRASFVTGPGALHRRRHHRHAVAAAAPARGGSGRRLAVDQHDAQRHQHQRRQQA